MKPIILIILSILSGILYRIGGKGGFKNAKLVRRLGCSFVVLFSLLLFRVYSQNPIVNILTYLFLLGLHYLSLSTYHDYLAKDKSSENWACWFATGFYYGLACLPLYLFKIQLNTILIRSVLLGIATMIVSEVTSKDWLEEFGRGFLLVMSLGLLI